MERKLELSDIAGYLPYGLNVRYLDRIGYIIGFEHNVLRLEYDTEHTFFGCEANIEHCKPILRPMNDLVKPMTHPDINNGEEFVPYIELGLSSRVTIDGRRRYFKFFSDFIQLRVWSDTLECEGVECNISLTPLRLKLLHQLHFDYRNLIGQGLAVDINTFNQ